MTVTDAEIDAIVEAGRSLSGDEHSVRNSGDTTFTWQYERTRDGLSRLYEKAKTSQWNVTTDLPWETDVDQERIAAALGVRDSAREFRRLAVEYEPKLATWGEREWTAFNISEQNSLLSQFLHGEQGALLCTSKIVETVPWIDAKYYASTQVMDEARHVEAFARYLGEKFSGEMPINPHLAALLDAIIEDPRWDITYLGMQIMVEGLALAAFGFIHAMTDEPLLKKLLRYVMSDEARHVAFGVLSLQEYYDGLGAAEIRERQEFAFMAVEALRDRWFGFHTDIWERHGIDPRPMARLANDFNPPEDEIFRMMLFSKIVPNCRKLGLLDAGDGWLRQRFTEIGIIQFEDWVDTSEEYSELDEVAKDRAGVATA